MEECLLMNIFPNGCPHEQGGRGEGGQPNADSCRQGEGGGSKLTKNVRTSFMDGLLVAKYALLKITLSRVIMLHL